MLFDFNNSLNTALKLNKVFAGANEDHIKLIMENGTKKKFKENDLITKEGDQAENLYLVVDGTLEVKLEQLSEKSGTRRITDIKLNTLKSGDCFGEYSLIDKQSVSANVRAVTPGILFKISSSDFEKITNKNVLLAKIIYKNLLELLVTRLRKKDKELDDVLIIM
ncbi:MAG: cyclic nucleotide-binding domain-containing protein [Desulfobacteraceae bacterium]|nr:cyclic nucleotide-binding domain-containing protein [Desulfobacteraceae bacterium]